jgi:hypothetical protein
MVESTQKIVARNKQLRQISKLAEITNATSPAKVIEVDLAFNFLE